MLAKVFGGNKITSQADPTTLPEPAERQEQHGEAGPDRNGLELVLRDNRAL